MAIKEQLPRRKPILRVSAKLDDVKRSVLAFVSAPGPTQFISDDDMNSTVRAILTSLDDGIVGFQQASAMYGSDFFENESPEFKRALCIALNTKFAGLKNFYWIKLATEIPESNPANSIKSE